MTGILTSAAAAIIGFLGILHFFYALHDILRAPKFFSPLDVSLLSSLRNTKTAIAPKGADYWSGVIGFNLSHCIGLLMFASMIWVGSLYGIVWMQSLLIVIGLSYVVVSYYCWFRTPTFCLSVATAFLTVAWWF
jgi:hypothetical protein